MSWNYRVIRKDGELAVYSVYYDNAGEIDGYSLHPFSPAAEDLGGLRNELELMLESLNDEIIDFNLLPKDRKEMPELNGA